METCEQSRSKIRRICRWTNAGNSSCAHEKQHDFDKKSQESWVMVHKQL
jgi:hypothetical protein